MAVPAVGKSRLCGPVDISRSADYAYKPNILPCEGLCVLTVKTPQGILILWIDTIITPR